MNLSFGTWQNNVNKLTFFFRENVRYFGVFLVFLLVILYQNLFVPVTSEMPIEEIKEEEVPSLTSSRAERKYENIIQSVSGDVYRLKMDLRASDRKVINFYVEGAVLGKLKIGELAVDPSEEGSYNELVFSTPGRYDTLVLELQKSNTEWGSVSINAISVSRLDIAPENIKDLKGSSFDKSLVRSEDLGRSYLHTFSLTNSLADFTGIFDASAGIRFDEKESAVVGLKKSGEYFTYEIDTGSPFQNVMIRAEQYGDAPNQMILEYSYNNSDWTMVPFIQDKGGPQMFSSSFQGDGRAQTLYVRATYKAEKKQSGFFALKRLSVQALTPKP